MDGGRCRRCRAVLVATNRGQRRQRFFCDIPERNFTKALATDGMSLTPQGLDEFESL